MAERRSVAADVVGSKPTSRPNHPFRASTKIDKVPRSPKQPVLFPEPVPVPIPVPIQAPPAGPAPPPRLFAGTSGWAYTTWRPGFYPEKLAPKHFLSFYATHLNSCEVNYTFRKLPTSEQLAGWLAQVEHRPGFRFSFKAPQRITHFSRLRDCEAPVKEFLDCLKPVAKAGKLGLILFQLPPNFKSNLPLLRDFLSLRCLRVKSAPRLAFEFRHESWFSDEAETVLRRFNTALCIAETDDFKSPEIHSAVGHTSFRLRKPGGYSPAEVAAFAAKLTALAENREVYAYFKHEDEPTGALNARAFLQAASEPR